MKSDCSRAPQRYGKSPYGEHLTRVAKGRIIASDGKDINEDIDLQCKRATRHGIKKWPVYAPLKNKHTEDTIGDEMRDRQDALSAYSGRIETESVIKSSRLKVLINHHSVFVILSILYGVMTYALTYRSITTFGGDFATHASTIYDIWLIEGFEAFSQLISYPGWHFVQFIFATLGSSPAVSAGIAAGFFNTATALLVFYLFRSAIGKSVLFPTVIAGCAVLVVTAIFFPLFNPSVYLGQGSPNIWHNPTYLAIRPAALASVALFTRLYRIRVFKLYEGVLFSLLLVLGLLLKPSFFQVFLPALGLFLIIDYYWNRDLSFIAKIAATLTLPLILLAYQFFFSFYSGGSPSGGVAILPFVVWRNSSPNILISIVLLWAFLLYSLFLFRKDIFQKGSIYILPVMIMFVALLQLILLAELGDRMYHGNFGWGYSLATFVGWFFLLPLFTKRAFVEKTLSLTKTIIGTGIITLHTLSGVYYFLFLMFNETAWI